ncbi:MAG: hypothetical protein NUV80_06050, partial [Candidatus Berkelbacteria bacterium]|nr:hypothetical protein [Candidatus Berkelbacteria bacterium]
FIAQTLRSEVDKAVKEFAEKLEIEFVRLLTTDSETTDARRKDFNQAIFDKERGWAVFTNTDLDMVLTKFRQAQALLERWKG